MWSVGWFCGIEFTDKYLKNIAYLEMFENIQTYTIPPFLGFAIRIGHLIPVTYLFPEKLLLNKKHKASVQSIR